MIYFFHDKAWLRYFRETDCAMPNIDSPVQRVRRNDVAIKYCNTAHKKILHLIALECIWAILNVFLHKSIFNACLIGKIVFHILCGSPAPRLQCKMFVGPKVYAPLLKRRPE